MSRGARGAVTVVIDGREVSALEGMMLVDAAKQGDVEIPVFCYEPKLVEPVGACRMCLVEIEGIPKLQTACSTPVRDGMVVYTQSDEVKEAQNAVVEFLLVNHPLDCPVCDKGGECPLQDISMGWGRPTSRFADTKRHFPKPQQLSPLVAIDNERCILCYRCVRFSQEISEDEQLQLLDRGDATYVGTFDDRPYVAPFHGNIIELCPVGALTSYTYRFRARPWDIEQAGSICTLCPSQCNVRFTVRDERVMRTLSRDNAEVDEGWLCDKGRFGFQMIASEDRISEPMERQANGTLRAISWEGAIARIATGLRSAGPATAALAGGGTSNEEAWLIGRIVRDALGSPHLASSSNPFDPALARELAVPAITARTADVGDADAILVVGCDPLNEMPIFDLRIRKAVRHGGAKLAVATERPSALDGGAFESVHYGPGDAARFLGALARTARGEQLEGENAEAVRAIAAAFGEAADPIVVWGERLWREPGAIAALIDCAEAFGLAEKAGAGLYEVPESANARGLREAGLSPGAGPGLTPAVAGHGADGIRAGLLSGELKTILLSDANPARTYPDSTGWDEALEAAEFVVAISMFDDESARNADIVLPAESFAEKEGTVTHPDGRLQRLRPNVPLPAGARPVWEALVGLAAALDLRLDLNTAPEVFAALAAEVPFYQGLTYEEIGGTGIRWQERPAGRDWAPGDVTTAEADSPHGGGAPGDATTGEADSPHRTLGSSEESLRAAAYASSPAASPGTTSPQDNSLALGTYRDIWADAVTDRNPALQFLAPGQRVELAAADAEEMGLGNGDLVRVSVNGSSVDAHVLIRDRMRAGAAFLIEGTSEGNANVLTNGMPCRVQISQTPGIPASGGEGESADDASRPRRSEEMTA